MKRYYLLLDLKNDPVLIKEYERHHRQVWPGVKQSILDAGIHQLEIYRVHNRLLMVLDTTEAFSFEKKAEADRLNPTVQEWEALMWKYQQAMPWAAEGAKWQLMEKICEIP